MQNFKASGDASSTEENVFRMSRSNNSYLFLQGQQNLDPDPQYRIIALKK
jgi:hypothetical protein